MDDRLMAVVERKSVNDLVSTLLSGRLRYALGELSALPRAAVVVEERYSEIFKQDRFRPSAVADGLAECQVRWPGVPIVFCETRALAEEWAYRYLAAAHAWAAGEAAAIERIEAPPAAPTDAGVGPGDPGPAELRRWARERGMAVPDRGRIPAAVREVWEVWAAEVAKLDVGTEAATGI